MIRASAAITLLLLGAVVTAWAWEVERRDQFYYAANPGGGGYYGGGYYGGGNNYYYNSYHPGWFSRWFWYGSGWNSGYSYRSHGGIYIDNRSYSNSTSVPHETETHVSAAPHVSTPSSSGISHGGFGSTGHAVGASS